MGAFNLSYFDQTNQLTGEAIKGGAVGTNWTYDTNTNDRRIKAITNSGAARSYEYRTKPENIISQVAETLSEGLDSRKSEPNEDPERVFQLEKDDDNRDSHEKDSPEQVWNYSYDAAYQLIRAQSSRGMQYAYDYDPAGNITSEQGPERTQSASYNSDDQITNVNGHPFVYDANGNLTDDEVRTYKWDAENRLVSVSDKAHPSRDTTFGYDALGRRIAIITNGVETRYLWCGEKLCQARNVNDVVTRRYYPEGEMIPGSGTLLYYAKDQLGSVRDVLAVQNGTRVASFDYDPYGNSTHTSGRVSTDFRYAGMFYEQNSGLYLTQYRAYDPGTGRWLSRDPIEEVTTGVSTVGKMLSTNSYQYARNDPVSLVDPKGQFAIAPLLIAGETVYIYCQYGNPEACAAIAQSVLEITFGLETGTKEAIKSWLDFALATLGIAKDVAEAVDPFIGGGQPPPAYPSIGPGSPGDQPYIEPTITFCPY